MSSGGAALGATFGGTAGTLDLEQPQGLSGTISGWQVGDVIDFVSTSVTSAGISGSTLTVTVSGGSAFTYQLAGQEANTGANVQSDGAGGTDVTLVTETPIVSSGQTLKVSSGQTSNGIVVLSGGTVDVLSGGVASGTVVSSGGTEIVSAGGTDDGTQISGGTQLDYGMASGTTVFTGSQVVESGGTAIGTILSGGTSRSGGSAGGTTIHGRPGSRQRHRQCADLRRHRTFRHANSATIFTGSQVVESGGTASGTIVSGGTQVVDSGGSASATTISTGGLEIVSGTDAGAQISGGTQDVYGTATAPRSSPARRWWRPAARRAARLSAAARRVDSGGSASATTISTGGLEIVSAHRCGAKITGGTRSFTALANSATIFTGSQVVEAGGTASGTIISGGTEIVSSGGTDDGAQDQRRHAGRLRHWPAAPRSSPARRWWRPAVSPSGTIISGGTETISSGGTDDGAQDQRRHTARLRHWPAAPRSVTGSQVVEAGGVASATIISGGTETVSSGGTDDGAQDLQAARSSFTALASGATICHRLAGGGGRRCRQRHDYQRRHASSGFRRQRQCHDDFHGRPGSRQRHR